MSSQVPSETEGDCVDVDVSEPAVLQAANNMASETARQVRPVKHRFFIMNHLPFEFGSWLHSDFIGALQPGGGSRSGVLRDLTAPAQIQ